MKAGNCVWRKKNDDHGRCIVECFAFQKRICCFCGEFSFLQESCVTPRSPICDKSEKKFDMMQIVDKAHHDDKAHLDDKAQFDVFVHHWY